MPNSSKENPEKKPFNKDYTGKQLMLYLGIGLALALYAIFGLSEEFIYVPKSRRQIGNGTTFTGESAKWLALAFIVAAVGCISFAIDFFDQRNNQWYYKIFRWIVFGIAIWIAIIAVNANSTAV